ncbi:ATP-binding protein [Spirillospora sp. NPDC050679]
MRISAAPGAAGALPAETTSFIGRRRELAEVGRALERSRLVTVCGVGGVGKTRLALRAAAGLRAAFPDGVWLVELSALRAPELLARTVAATLRLPDRATGDPADLLAGHLAGRRLLLVLDTCEHLIDACAALAEALVRAAPRLQVLATSRELLDVLGEHTITLEPMEAPDPDAAPDAADCEAAALFADRAAATSPGFRVTPGNREAVARICHRLEGIPLAIELAAGRLRTMPLERILDRLDGPASEASFRHRTLRAAVAWSHDLCSPAERALWARLSVFPGDFDAAAATAVCADPGGPGVPAASGEDLSAAALPGLLRRLADKSVLRHDPATRRYRMPDTLREFGAGLPHERGELHRRHHRRVAALAERAAGAAVSDCQLHWCRRLHAENADLRVALEWALTTPGEQDAGLRLAVRLRHYWYSTGRIGEGRDWYRRALEATGGDAPDRGWALYGAGMFAVLQGDTAAGDPLLAEAFAAAAAGGDLALRAHVVHEQGRSRFYQGDLPGALHRYRRARRLYARLGHRTPESLTVLADLAAVESLHGSTGAALAWCEEGLRRSEATGEQWARAFTLWMRGAAHWLDGDLERAVADVRESLRIKAAFDDLMGITMALDVLMVCASAAGDSGRAAVLAGVTDLLWETLRAPVQRGPHYSGLRAAGIEAARAALGDGAMDAALRRGRALPVADAVLFGLADVRPPGDAFGPADVPPPRDAFAPLKCESGGEHR